MQFTNLFYLTIRFQPGMSVTAYIEFRLTTGFLIAQAAKGREAVNHAVRKPPCEPPKTNKLA